MAYSCTKFEVSCFNRFGHIFGGPAFKNVTVTLTTPLSGKVCHRQAGTCYDQPSEQNRRIKLEVSIFTRYKNNKVVARCIKCG